MRCGQQGLAQGHLVCNWTPGPRLLTPEAFPGQVSSSTRSACCEKGSFEGRYLSLSLSLLSQLSAQIHTNGIPFLALHLCFSLCCFVLFLFFFFKTRLILPDLVQPGLELNSPHASVSQVHHPPQFPLPNKITQCKKEDQLCPLCGILGLYSKV